MQPLWVFRGFLQTMLFLVLSSSLLYSQSVNLKVYSGIARSVAQLAPNQVVLLKPGRFLDPLYDQSNPDQRYADAIELNRLLISELIYRATSKDLSQVYSDILTKEQWASVPLLPAQIKELDNLRSILFIKDNIPTPGYGNYLEKKKAFEVIRDKREKTPTDQWTAELVADYEEAENALSLARQARYEPAENRLQILTELSSLKWRETAIFNLTNFSSLSSTGNRFLHTETSPSLDSIESLNWVTVKMTSKQLRMTDPLPKFTGSIDSETLKWWFWSNTTDVDSSICSEGINQADYTIEFEITIVPIKRDWLDKKVFDSQAWRWKSGSSEILSDGESDTNKGTAPLYAESVILIKSLIISGSGVKPCLAYIRKAARNHNEVGFGPFRLAGSTAPQSDHYLPPILTKSSIRVVYPQILGYGVEILPRTPNPNPDFIWTGK